MKRIICYLIGHTLETKPVTETISGTNWVRKCTRCGRYIMKSDLGYISLSEKEAMNFKKNFESEVKPIRKMLAR